MITELMTKFGPFPVTLFNTAGDNRNKKFSKGASLQFYILGTSAEHVSVLVIAVFPGGRKMIIFEKIYIDIGKHWKDDSEMKIWCDRLEAGDDFFVDNIQKKVAEVLCVTAMFEEGGVRFFYTMLEDSSQTESSRKNIKPHGETKKHDNHINGLFNDIE
jgi:hypothetical protein